MNHDETFSDGPMLEPELEARIVAWVAGEASAFEAAELERIIAARPEALAFRDRITAANRLLNQAMRPDPAPLRMSADKRAKLLAALDGEKNKTPADSSVLVYNRKAQTSRRVWRRFLTVAAGVMIGLGVFNVARYSGNKYSTPKEVTALRMREEEAPSAAQIELADQSKVAAARLQKRKSEAAFESRREELRAEPSALASDALTPSQLAGAAATNELKDIGSAITVVSPEVEKKADLDGSLAAFGLSAPPPAAAAKPRDGSVASSASKFGGPGAGFAPSVHFEAKTAESKREQLDKKLAESVVPPPASESYHYYARPAAAPAAPAEANSILFGKGSQNPVQSADRDLFKASGPSENLSQVTMSPFTVEKTSAPRAEEETNAQHAPVSTFSLHVSDVSFRTAQSALARGDLPAPESIRVEEFYNAFRYEDPAPGAGEKVSCRIEQSAHPFLQQRNFVRIAMKVPAVGRGVAQPLRLTVLLDISGSMEREDRAAAVRRAFATLVSLLGPDDRVTLIGFARQTQLLAENVSGLEAKKLLTLVETTNPEGGTNIEEALRLGSEQALKIQSGDAQNRIVLLTDGAANLGDAKPDDLMKQVEALRQRGIAFDACGVGLDGVDDTILEALTRKGDGRYYVLDTPEAADANFAQQLAGAFRPAAKNVKVQVRFNPARVANYRLIGFEKHRLNEADFRNDAVDAAELAADEGAVALYQVQVQPQGEGEVGEVFVRFRDVATGNMVERSWTMPYEAQAAAFDHASPTLQLTGTSAFLAEKLGEDPAAQSFEMKELVPIISELRQRYHNDRRVQEFATMFEQYRRMKSE